MAIYNKALPTGIGEIVIYTGANLDEVVTLVDAANVEVRLGYLYVGGELINPGDAVAMTDDETPVLAPKIPAATLGENLQQIDALVYDGTNLNEVIAMAGISNIVLAAEELYVHGQLVSSGDALATTPQGEDCAHISAATLAADYTAA